MDVMICATDQCVTFAKGRERNRRLSQCLTQIFVEYFISAEVKG